MGLYKAETRKGCEKMSEDKLLKEIEKGILREEFLVYYQPIVNAQSEKVASAEALVRWNKNQKEILPGTFIPLLEKQKRISLLDLYMLEKVTGFLKKRKTSGSYVVPVSINLSWLDLCNSIVLMKLVEKLEECKKLSIPTRIEITESTYTAILENQTDPLTTIKKCGTELLMDDYGTGYSSLEALQNYNFDILKIDISFVRQIETNDKTRKILQSTIEMAHELGMKLVAEGVENIRQVEFFRNSGCDYLQGYYFYKPMPEEKFAELLDNITEE